MASISSRFLRNSTSFLEGAKNAVLLLAGPVILKWSLDNSKTPNHGTPIVPLNAIRESLAIRCHKRDFDPALHFRISRAEPG